MNATSVTRWTDGAKLIKDSRGYRACNASGVCRTYKTHLRAWKWAFGK